MPQNMDVETVVKIEGYSVEYQEESDNGQRQSDETKTSVSVTPVPLLPKPCGFQNYDSTSPTTITLHPGIGTAPTCNRVVYPGESPFTNTKDVKGGSSRKEEASAKEKFKCFILNCSKSFDNKMKLDTHLKNNHGQNGLFKCSFCETMWPTNSALETHLISHSTARSHHCNACSKSFKHIKDLRIHKQKVHQTSLASTEKSKLVIHDRHEPSLLLKLLQSPILGTPTTLNLPDSTNDREAALVLVDPNTAPEALLLEANPTNKCEICLKAFKSSQALKEHKSTTHAAENEKRFKCHICPKSFSVSLKLKQHLYFVHGEKIENLKILECEFCGRQYPCLARLEAHIVNKHVVDKEFECSVCSKTFIDQEALTKHQFKIHKQQTKIHLCDVCSAGFNSKAKLAGHLKRVHKKLHCHKCGRSFENKSEFNGHSNSEATNNLKAELKFKCSVCSVSLSTQCNFNIHIDCHSRKEKSTVVTIV